MKLICTQTTYNAYLQKEVSEFETIEIEPMDGEINVLSNFDSAFYFEFTGDVPNVETKYLVWLTDANGLKNGLRQMSETEKAEVLANEAKAARCELFKGYKYKISVNYWYAFNKYLEWFIRASVEPDNPREIVGDTAVFYCNTIPVEFEQVLANDTNFIKEEA